jgi:3-hydroxyacyl-CoA dehydrogenase/3a,7a,12a-trihydroxy-5b-cholest-24-enoyl-CoA hydratase
MWRENDGQRIVFRCKVKERDKVVISNAAVELFKEIPKPAATKKAPVTAGAASAPAVAAGASDEATSSEAFAVIRDHLERNGGLAAEVGKTFLFRLTEPTSAWLIDLKNGKGAVTEATGDTKADCLLDLSDADFRAMVAGKADPMKLWTDKKLKIGGDIMASQKLMFLKKIDKARAADVVARLRGADPGGGQTAATPTQTGATAAAASPAAAQAPAILTALRERLASHAGLAKEIGAVIGLVVTSPDAAFTLDLSGEGRVVEEKPANAAVTLTLSDADLAALAKGEPLGALYQHGRVRIDGDARVARKLTFWKGLL